MGERQVGMSNSRSLVPRAPGSSWTHAELDHFRISIIRERSFVDFFGRDPPTDLSNDVCEFVELDMQSVILQTHISAVAIRSREVMVLWKDVIAVTKTHRFEESAVDDMSRSLLHLFDYDGGNRAIRTRTTLDLEMSNGKTEATPDLSVETLDMSIKLLVQEDKSYDVGNDRHLKEHQPEAQLCAEMIAAYQENVKLYERLGRGEFPSEQVMPGIVMLGTCPTFYVMKVTKEFSECVKAGITPQFTTTVKKYVVPNLPVNLSDALLSREHRQHIAQCLEAFKRTYLVEVN